ncbi:chorismate mutase [Thermoanaerobacter kivui]|nr:chorismate mutase [Thermoanaerobacter kivui]
MLTDTTILIKEIIEVNKLKERDIISIFFSATKDLDAAYPAEAVRNMGITSVPMMCFQEMDVKGSLSHCIRVMLLINCDEEKEIKHVYLKDTKKLRPDLV